VLYFSDCQSGASAGCVPGNNANAGTSASAPKQNLSGISLNSLPAGTQLLFARGGAWSSGVGGLRNLNATPTAPLVFATYTPSWGGTARALWRGAIDVGGQYQQTTWHGGYTFRGLKLDGNGSSGMGVFVHSSVRNITFEDMEVTRFRTGIEVQQAGSGVTDVVVRNSLVHRNTEQGFFGYANNLTLEGNTFEANNPSGSVFFHGTYIGGHGTNLRVVGNTYRNNSVVNGTCLGGNLTVHGQWEGGLIENNTVEVPASQMSCYGISTNPGYSTAEWMRNFTIRANRVINTGCGVCSSSVPGVTIENNVVWPGTSSGTGIAAGENQADTGDLRSSGVVRNNTFCGSGSVMVAGAVTQSGNVTRTGADASTSTCAR